MRTSEKAGVELFDEFAGFIDEYISHEGRVKALKEKLRTHYVDGSVICYHRTVGVTLIDKKGHMRFAYSRINAPDKFDYKRGVIIALSKILHPHKNGNNGD